MLRLRIDMLFHWQNAKIALFSLCAGDEAAPAHREKRAIFVAELLRSSELFECLISMLLGRCRIYLCCFLHRAVPTGCFILWFLVLA